MAHCQSLGAGRDDGAGWDDGVARDDLDGRPEPFLFTLSGEQFVVIEVDGIPAHDEDWTAVGAEPFKSARIALNDGTHVLPGDTPFGVIAYGWGQYVSYG